MADSEQQHKKRSRLCVTQSTNAVKGMVDVSDSADEGRIVCLYYKYVPVADVDAAIKDHEALCKRLGLDGRVRIASEGINGTLTGSAESIVEYEKQLRLSFGDDIDFKTSSASVGVSRDSRICRSDGGGPFFEKHLAVRKVTQICSLGRYSLYFFVVAGSTFLLHTLTTPDPDVFQPTRPVIVHCQGTTIFQKAGGTYRLQSSTTLFTLCQNKQTLSRNPLNFKHPLCRRQQMQKSMRVPMSRRQRLPM
eukprot:INCI12584.1.p1 GENE.INCI12584.1~~INCI12584.1.p1  ORF type:complete len:272 (-),score=39.77 INCI12584.1:973-1719(-)